MTGQSTIGRHWRPLVVLAILAGLGWLGLRAEAPAVRYAAEACRWQILTARSPAPVHLALFGSSRMAAAFAPGVHDHPEGLQLNLARTDNDLGQVAVSLRDLLDQRPVRHIVIAHDPQAPARRWSGLPMLATWRDLWREAWPDQLAALPRRVVDKLVWAAIPDPDTPDPCLTTWPVHPTLLTAAPPAAPFALDADHLFTPKDQAWLIVIRALARQHGATVHILQVPARGQAPWPPDFLANATVRTGVAWMAPPSQLIAGLQRAGYADNRHLNDRGRRQMQEWLDHAL